ncbi:MAG: hypothetical protein GF317_22190 [Candidatus Lokiarchaeota archaeon]|nr:hypothetical protein [Candidatus Lokiarchaeota archaeon]MBD3202171.1 hypothetical protein [Candidatus Lokiarchaeota archaeon]
MDIELDIEDIEFKQLTENQKILHLPKLSKEEEKIVDPIVAPTSGLRIQIFDVDEHDGKFKYTLTRRKLFLFLRLFKAISVKFKEIKKNENLKVLIFTDDRPSSKILLDYSSQIFANDGFELYYQDDLDGKSRISSPYGSASVALYEDIDLVIVLTASHNELSWNGIKFYINYPIPISGDLFKDVSKIALTITDIKLRTKYDPIKIDAIKKNNDYILDLLSNIINIENIQDSNIIIWPYLGKAEGILRLFRRLGANITLIEETINPPNPIKKVKEKKLQKIMKETKSNIALLLDADRDRIALYVKQNGKYYTFIPNEIYSAMHNILARVYGKKIINVRTVPSDLRGDETSFLNILTGVGYKHLGIILYFLFDIEVDQSKINSALLYMEGDERELIQIDEPEPLKEMILQEMEENGIDNAKFVVVMWEESGGHTLNILDVEKDETSNEFKFSTNLPLIADKYPVPALVIITELLASGHQIPKAIDWSIKGINRTIDATDEQKVKIMKEFEKNDGKELKIDENTYDIKGLYDNNGNIDIYQLKSSNSTLYFRPSGTGPNVRFYIFGDRETYLNEIKAVMRFVKENYA